MRTDFQDALRERNPDYVARVHDAIRAAKDYQDTVRKPARDLAADYYDATEPRLPGVAKTPATTGTTYRELLDDEADGADNKASVVSSDVRDVVLAVMPSLIRIFASSEHVVDFVPNRPEDVDAAKDATDYVGHQFWNMNDGFLILHTAFKDALVLREGIVKWWTERVPRPRTKSFTNIPPAVLANIVAEMPGAEVVAFDGGPDRPVADATVRFVDYEPRLRVEAVPPDEYLIAPDARSCSTASLQGHVRMARVAEVVALGYDRELVESFATSLDDPSNTRRRRDRLESARVADEAYVLYGEFTLLGDPDDTGIEELRSVVTLGEDWTIIADDATDRRRFAIFSPDPRPHEAIGDSLSDLAMEAQRVHTNLTRGILDSLTASINPDMVVNAPALVDIQEVLTDTLGRVIRGRGSPRDIVDHIQTPFLGPQALQVLDASYMALARRTGLSDASKGLDPKALQSSTAVGVDAVITGAQERIELIARNLAETGLKAMFKGILEEAVSHPHPRCQAYINSEFKTFDPSLYDIGWRVRVNPSMGKGADYVRLNALMMIKQDQLALIQQYGATNGIVGPNEVLNTITDILDLANIKNTGRYFKYMSKEQWQALLTAPPKPDPALILAQAQLEKVKAGVVSETARLDAAEARERMVDDRERDKTLVDGFLKLLEMHLEQKQAELSRLNTPTEGADSGVS